MSGWDLLAQIMLGVGRLCAAVGIVLGIIWLLKDGRHSTPR